jgi:hypothetical protein
MSAQQDYFGVELKKAAGDVLASIDYDGARWYVGEPGQEFVVSVTSSIQSGATYKVRPRALRQGISSRSDPRRNPALFSLPDTSQLCLQVFLKVDGQVRAVNLCSQPDSSFQAPALPVLRCAEVCAHAHLSTGPRLLQDLPRWTGHERCVPGLAGQIWWVVSAAQRKPCWLKVWCACSLLAPSSSMARSG